MSTHSKGERAEQLLTVAEVAELLRTSERFPRRLIAERRIRFTRIGRHVRIPESALREFIESGLVEPVTTAVLSVSCRSILSGSCWAEKVSQHESARGGSS